MNTSCISLAFGKLTSRQYHWLRHYGSVLDLPVWPAEHAEEVARTLEAVYQNALTQSDRLSLRALGILDYLDSHSGSGLSNQFVLRWLTRARAVNKSRVEPTICEIAHASNVLGRLPQQWLSRAIDWSRIELFVAPVHYLAAVRLRAFRGLAEHQCELLRAAVASHDPWLSDILFACDYLENDPQTVLAAGPGELTEQPRSATQDAAFLDAPPTLKRFISKSSPKTTAVDRVRAAIADGHDFTVPSLHKMLGIPKVWLRCVVKQLHKRREIYVRIDESYARFGIPVYRATVRLVRADTMGRSVMIREHFILSARSDDVLVDSA